MRSREREREVKRGGKSSGREERSEPHDHCSAGGGEVEHVGSAREA